MKKIVTLVVMAIMMACYCHAAIYIVGSSPFGDWNPADGVEMTDNGNGTYSYKAAVNGTVWFVFADGLSSDWDIFNSGFRYGPANGDEQVVEGAWTSTQKAGDHGAYQFTGSGEEYDFTFDLANSRFKVEGLVDIGHTIYWVAGEPSALFGTEWDLDNPDNQMTRNAAGIHEWTRTGVNLKAGSIEFMVVGGHDWGNSWPADNNVAQVPVDGTYAVTITFNPNADDDSKISCSVVLISESQPALDGDVNGDGEVNVGDVNQLIDAILSGGESQRFDVNGDGEISVADISLVISIILAGNLKDLTGEIVLEHPSEYDGCVYICYMGDEPVTLTVFLDGEETGLQDGFLDLPGYGEYQIDVVASARGYNDLSASFTCCYWETPLPPPMYEPEISITVEDNDVIVRATGQGEVRLYIDGVEADNPCSLERLEEDYVVSIVATCQVEGIDPFFTSHMEYLVPAKDNP